MGKKDIYIHETLIDRINWKEYFDPKNQGETFQDNRLQVSKSASKPQRKLVVESRGFQKHAKPNVVKPQNKVLAKVKGKSR